MKCNASVIAKPLTILIVCGVLSLSASATVIDLTAIGNSGVVGDGKFDTNVSSATGTGGFDSFVQQSPQGNGTTSHAYNTTENNVLDNKASDQFNRSIQLSDVPVATYAGEPHLRFSLDINESQGGGAEFISLDEIQVFVGGTANSSVTTFTSSVLDHDGTLVYRMDSAAMDSWVALDASLNSGSGSGDVFFYLPQSLFNGFGATDVVTFYSAFGGQGVDPTGFTGDFGASGGFEEWGITPIPEPATLALCLACTCGLLTVRRV